MATDTIFLYYLNTCLFDKDHLRFGPERKNCGMTHAILRFKIVLPENIIMWDMALVTIGDCAVRTMAPGCILWRHDVAVHAGFRLIRQIGVCPGSSKYKCAHPDDHSQEDDNGNLPFGRRQKEFNEFS